MGNQYTRTLMDIVRKLEKTLPCNCQPGKDVMSSTGHDWLCRIHRAAIVEATDG